VESCAVRNEPASPSSELRKMVFELGRGIGLQRLRPEFLLLTNAQ
jgi:hypothetical protein